MRIDRTIEWQGLWRDQVGAAMIEFTLLAPFLLFLGLGMSEFGRFLYQYQLVLEGLRDGARYLARTLDPTNSTNQSHAKCIAITGAIDFVGSSCSGTARVDGWAFSDVQIAPKDPPFDNGDNTYRGGTQIYVIEASTTFNYADLGFLSALGLPQISIEVTHQQRAIGE